MANDMSHDMSSQRLNTGFEITRFLEGSSLAWGVFEDRFGRVRRRFRVEVDGRWEGRIFVLDERFSYDDGETEARVWRITPGTDGAFTGETEECVGAARGWLTGGGTAMQYRFRLALKARTVVVDFDDRIHQLDTDVALNRATVRKWGFKLGRVTIFFVRGYAARQMRNGTLG